LGPYRAKGRIPSSVLLPPPQGLNEREVIAQLARKRGVPPYDAPEFSQAELDSLMWQVSEMWGESDPERERRGREYWSYRSVRHTDTVAGDWGAVSEVVRDGRIAVFDAKPLFPASIFNTTVKKMAQNEGAHADRVVTRNVFKKPMSFKHFSEHIGRRDSGGSESGYVNTKRLPKFFSELPDTAEKLGVKDDVLRSQSFLWLGVSGPLHPFDPPFPIHYDEEPNVYVQVSGEIIMLLIPPSYTDFTFGGFRHPSLPALEETMASGIAPQVPVHLIRLRPGQGVTFPGRTYHSIMVPKMDRISLNFFYIPRWRRMEYTPSDWYSQEASRSLERLAVRQLWAKTLSRMYDTTGRGIVFMGQKLEYI